MGVIGLTAMTLHWIKGKIHEKREKERPGTIFKERRPRRILSVFSSTAKIDKGESVR
jgi:hypothetical protein